MPVYSISGIDQPDVSGTVEVDKQAAESNFLVMVNRNDFSLKTLLNSDHDILYGPVRQWYTGNGYDFNQLILILNG